MPATVRSATIVGIDAVPVDVEVEVLPGLPSVTVVEHSLPFVRFEVVRQLPARQVRALDAWSGRP